MLGVASVWWEGNPCKYVSPSLETDVLNNFLTETTVCTVCYPFPCIYIHQLARFDEFLIGAHWKKPTVLDLGKIVKEGLEKNGMIGWQFNTIGVYATRPLLLLVSPIFVGKITTNHENGRCRTL